MSKKSKSNQKNQDKKMNPTNEKIEKYINEKVLEIAKILNPKENYALDFIKQGTKHLLGLFKNNKKIIVGDYNFYGIYQQNTKLWIWASSIPGVDLKHIKHIQKIKQFSHLFESDNDKKLNFYFQLLSQDVLFIPNEEMLEWINDLILYLSEDVYIFNPVNSEDNIQFISLSNIKQKYI
jgi:hypothetical protein